MTTLESIKRAMRLVNVIQADESPTASEGQDALTILNSMLHSWVHSGIKLNHIDKLITDTLPFPPNHDEAIVYNLAARIAQEYGRPVPIVVAELASRGYRDLQNYYASPRDAQLDDMLNPVFNQNSYWL